jgi:hypothetical protein
VTPNSTIHYVRNGGCNHTEFLAKLLVGVATLVVKPLNRAHLCFCQLAAWMSVTNATIHGIELASFTWHSTLGRRVQLVIGIGASKKMCRITARGCVTTMANKVTSWYRTLRQFVSGAMRRLNLSFVRHRPITTTGNRRLPQPAVIGPTHIHFRPKVFYKVFVKLFPVSAEGIATSILLAVWFLADLIATPLYLVNKP